MYLLLSKPILQGMYPPAQRRRSNHIFTRFNVPLQAPIQR